MKYCNNWQIILTKLKLCTTVIASAGEITLEAMSANDRDDHLPADLNLVVRIHPLSVAHRR
ncbi:hypothetical protein RHIZ404_90032 [Rhizobium sp. EC-SD404]|nr:hypothetical protein RHIZ404_90032 [Rhizobium sp. EC-SD404]